MSKRTPRPVAAPRAHHYVPQCWLAGFTQSGRKTGRLWVTDLANQKQWASSPPNTGHERDFYRVSMEDPDAVEKIYGKVENDIAPILRQLDEERRSPTNAELDALLYFMAIQWGRVPAFRPTILRIADGIHRSEMAKALKSPEAWAEMLRNAGISPEEPGTDYDRMREFLSSGDYSLSAEPDWFAMRAFQAVETIVPALRKRAWFAAISKEGHFIASDAPVALDGPLGQMVGFKNADIVTFPVSRHVLLCGTRRGGVRPPATRKFIASMNTFMMLTAQYVYSHVQSFCWLDERGFYRTDWQGFSKDKFRAFLEGRAVQERGAK